MIGSNHETSGYETVILQDDSGRDEMWQLSWVTPAIAEMFVKYVRGRVWGSARRDLKDGTIALSEYEQQVSMLRRQTDTDYAWHPPLGGKQVMGDGITEYMRDPLGRLFLLRLFLQENHKDQLRTMTDDDLYTLTTRDDDQFSDAMLVCAGLRKNRQTPEQTAPGSHETDATDHLAMTKSKTTLTPVT